MTLQFKLQLVVICDEEEVCVDELIVLDKQHEVRSTLLVSQLPVDASHAALGHKKARCDSGYGGSTVLPLRMSRRLQPIADHRTINPGCIDVGTTSTPAAPVSTVILIALLVCLIPTTIGGLLSAIGIDGIDRVTRYNVLALSGRAVEAAGDVDVLLPDKTGTITQARLFDRRSPIQPRATRPKVAAFKHSRSTLGRPRWTDWPLTPR
jgi:hypothetical protein